MEEEEEEEDIAMADVAKRELECEEQKRWSRRHKQQICTEKAIILLF